MKRFLALCCLIAIAVACNPVQKSEKAGITVSILPQKYFVERIAGDRFDIHVITPPGASPETYEPTPRQMKTLSESALYFSNGYLMFEDHIIEKMGNEISEKMIDLSQDIDLIAGEIVEHGDHVHLHGIDPHYWLAPNEVKIQAETILGALKALDPDNSAAYEANFQEFINDIDALDIHIRSLIVKSKTRTFLIYHPAFAYFARAYDLTQVALELDGKEPTISHTKFIADLARKEGINTILIQSQFNKAAAEVVANEINGNVELLDPLPENWLENMYAIAHIFQKVLNP